MPRRFDPIAQQESISEAVWRVMSAGGPQSLTLRMVAAEAGCSTGLVLHRFPDKKALLVHARQMLDERTQQRMDQEILTHPDPRVALEEVMIWSLLGSEFDARIWLGFLAASVGDPELASVQNTAHQHYLDTVGRLVGQCRPDWDPERLQTVTMALIGLSSGLAALASVNTDVYTSTRQESALRSAIAALVDV